MGRGGAHPLPNHRRAILDNDHINSPPCNTGVCEKNNVLIDSDVARYAFRPVFYSLKCISPYIAFYSGGRVFRRHRYDQLSSRRKL